MSSFAERLAEERIQAAIAAGKFDNLHGAGKPLTNTEPFTQERWLRDFIEREELDPLATAPTVLALRKEAQGFPQSLLECDDEAAVRGRLTDYNRRVADNRLHPDPGIPPTIIAPLVNVQALLEQWRELRSKFHRSKNAG